ncbi:hypothetical protein X777_09608, partial [Ooceraea biroi]
KRYNFNLGYKCTNTLERFVNSRKDPLEKFSHCNVVYRIACNDCDASYVGQTKRKLNTRVKEHRRDINKKSGSPSVISAHKLESGHDFNWNDVKILDEERSYNKRLVSEMINIKRQLNPLNSQNDTELLSNDYLPILNSFPSL